MMITLMIEVKKEDESKKIMRELDDYILQTYDVEQVIMSLKKG